MKGKRFTDEQITYALRQAEGGTPVTDVCRQMGVSEASFYLWKKKAAFTWPRDYSSGLRVMYLWLSVAGVAGILVVTTRALWLQQFATTSLAVLAYAVAAPQVNRNVVDLLRLRRLGAIPRG